MKIPTRGKLLRNLIVYVLTLSTMLAFSICAVPAVALGAGDVIYLNVGDRETELVSATFLDEGSQLFADCQVTMETDSASGLYRAVIPADAVFVQFYIDFQGDDSASVSALNIPSNTQNVYDLSTESWYALGDQPAPPESDTPVETMPDEVVPDKILPDNPESGKYSDQQGNKSATITPSGTVGGSSIVTDVVSVDILWDAMEFVYTPSSRGEWDPDSYTYVGGTAASWTSTTNTITVTNHSNVGVTAAFRFTSEASLDLIGEFRNAENQTVSSVNLASAESAQGSTGAPTTQNVTFHITDGAIENDTDSLGTITVTISK